MKQILITDELRMLIPPLYSQDGNSNPTAYVKLFNPYGQGTWYVLEMTDDIMYCYCHIHEWEYGYVSLTELINLPACILGRWQKNIQGIERDIHFTPTPIETLCEKLQNGR